MAGAEGREPNPLASPEPGKNASAASIAKWQYVHFASQKGT